ncbi:MAG: hypothetical protein ACTTJE_04905 [Schwartzia sp. (in: firmicutes)]
MLNLQKISEILAAAKSGSKEYHPVSFPKTFFTQKLMAACSNDQGRFSFLTHGGTITGTWNSLDYEENPADFLLLNDVEVLPHHGEVCHLPHFLLFVDEIVGFSLPD